MEAAKDCAEERIAAWRWIAGGPCTHARPLALRRASEAVRSFVDLLLHDDLDERLRRAPEHSAAQTDALSYRFFTHLR